MKGFKSTSTNPYTYTQSGVWKKGQYTFQAVVLSDSGYAFAFQRSDTTWWTVDLSWQVKDGSYSKIQWTFTLEVDAVAFRLIANTVTGETIVVQPMLEKGKNGSTPIAHEEDLRGMDGDNHEFIFTRNTTGIAPDTPLSTQDDDYVPEDWTDNAQGVTSAIPFEFVSMRERKNGVWLDFSPPSLWAKWGEDGLSVNLLVEGHYKSHWEGITKVVEIVGGVDVGGNEVVKVSAVFRKGEENIAATVSQSRGFQWYVNGVHLTAFDNQPFITLDETYGDGFADYVVLSYLVNSIREEERREIINISEGMDGVGEEFIFKANNSPAVPPTLPQTTDVGYQDDDYHGDWSDDPVAPTELNQFVWVAKRKKIGGIWEAFGTPSVWAWWLTDGITISPNQQGYTYRADLNGDIIGSLANGMVELTIMNGSTPITCSSAISGETPTENGTYRVTRTLGDGITTNESLSDGKYRITPTTLDVDEATVELEIKIMVGGAVTSYPLTLTYRKQFDGADGKSTEFIFKGHTSDTTAPALPFTSQQDDWYGQGTANEWNDDLVAPTKSLPYVWASQRKKVDGVWGAFTAAKVWLRYAEDGDGITSTTIEYAKSPNGTTPPESGWSTSVPEPTQGWYLWTRTTTTYKVAETTVSYSVSYWSEDGDEGDPAKTITLSANATKITVGPGNVSSPTQISVKATAVNTTVETWEYSIDGAAFTTTEPSFVTVVSATERTISSSPLFKTITLRASRVADEASGIITISREGSAPYVDETTNTWWAWSDISNLYVDTGMSPVGVDGRIPYPAGYWEEKTYTRDANYAPYVQHTEAIYLLVDDLAEPTDVPGTSNKWKVFNTWQAVFVDSLVAAFAKIGGAVFTGDTGEVASGIRGRMISEMGEDGTTTFKNYTGDDGSWQPNIMLDFVTGKAKFANADIVGHITATSGSIGGVTIENETLSVATPTTNGILSSADKAYIDQLKSLIEYDADNDAIKALKSLYSTGEVSAYGLGSGGSGGSGGGGISMMQGWTIPAGAENFYAPANLVVPFYNDIRSRVSDLEDGAVPIQHSHIIGDVTGLQSALDGKASSTHTHSGVYEPAFTKNTAFNKDFGTTSDTVARGNHTHSGVYEPAFTKNTAFNKAFGTTSGTVAEGNDNRIVNGQTAYGWGNHASAGYALSSALANYALSTHNHSGVYEPVFTKNTAFNKNFGTTSTTVARGNHTHSGVYEPSFSKNTAFNKDFGTTSGTVAQGNDSRIVNGQTAYGWGNHASAGYATSSVLSNYVTLAASQTITGAKTFSSNLTASVSVTTPKVIFSAAGWSLEQSGTELQMKYNGTAKMRFLSGGSIVATQEITAYS